MPGWSARAEHDPAVLEPALSLAEDAGGTLGLGGAPAHRGNSARHRPPHQPSALRLTMS